LISAPSAPQADAEAGGEKNAERHDADHPHVFGFHGSISPFLEMNSVPSG
jgi:hypothetical protein